jgi:hypothetical protein
VVEATNNKNVLICGASGNSKLRLETKKTKTKQKAGDAAEW